MKTRQMEYKLRVLQINTGNSRPALDLALLYARRKKADVICITEPPMYKKGKIGCPGWSEHLGDRAAILTKSNITIKKEWKELSTVGIEIGKTRIISAYCSPNEEVEQYLDALSLTAESPTPLVITGDFNCRWIEFDRKLRRRRKDAIFYDFIIGNDLKIENDGTPTLIHQGVESTNDYTITKRSKVNNWMVDTLENTLSDHRFIYFEVEDNTVVRNRQEKKKMDQEKLKVQLSTIPQIKECKSPEDAEINADIITNWLSNAVKNSTTTEEYKSTTYWWNENLEAQRIKLKQINRKIERCKNNNQLLVLKREQQEQRVLHKINIKKAKVEAWKNLINKDRPWGKPYKTIIKNPERNSSAPPTSIQKANGLMTRSESETNITFLHAKFPRAPKQTAYLTTRNIKNTRNDAHNVTTDIVANIIRKLNNRSAPGLDGINHKTLKILNIMHPTLLTEILNQCLQWAVFPKKWKEGKLVLIYKNKGDKTKADSYRPLTMLSALGKLLEKCLMMQIDQLVENKISDSQYGFRKGRSCEDCILAATKWIKKMKHTDNITAVVSLDIKGAFDHVLWPWIVQELERLEVPQHLISMMTCYFKDRKVYLGENSIDIERGCPQGSVVGPLLWNISYNFVLENLHKRFTRGFAYADDTLLLMTAKNVQDVYKVIKYNVMNIEKDMGKAGLLLNVGKTEIMLLKKQGIVIAPPIELNGIYLRPKNVMKYLGVWLDHQLSWEPHLKKVCEKGMAMIPKLANLARNTYGYNTSARRTMLDGTIGAYMKYASAVYVHRLKLKSMSKYIDRLHRSMVICYGRLYKTVSYLPATVICNWVPIKYEITARALRYAMKKKTELHGATLLEVPHGANVENIWSILGPQVLDKWKCEYRSCGHGEWTQTLIQEPGYTNLDPCFWVNQAISGHGVFGHYLAKMRRRPTPECACGYAEETPEHVLRYCPLFENGRPETLDVENSETLKFFKDTIKTLWENERMNNRRRIEN